MDSLKLSLVIGSALLAALSLGWLAWHYVAVSEQYFRLFLALG